MVCMGIVRCGLVRNGTLRSPVGFGIIQAWSGSVRLGLVRNGEPYSVQVRTCRVGFGPKGRYGWVGCGHVEAGNGKPWNGLVVSGEERAERPVWFRKGKQRWGKVWIAVVRQAMVSDGVDC